MTIIINQLHPAVTNVSIHNEGVEQFVFFVVKHPFQYQGQRIVGIDFHSINPEPDADFIRRNRIVRIEFNETQARVVETNGSRNLGGAIGTDTEHTIEVKRNQTNNPPPPPPPTINTPQFIIESIVPTGNIKLLKVTYPFTFDNERVEYIIINSNSPDLQVGNTVIVEGVNVGRDKIRHNRFGILTNFTNIRVVVRGGGNNPPPPPPINNAFNIIQAALNNNDNQLIALINKYEGLDKNKFTVDILSFVSDNELNNDQTINYTELESLIQQGGYTLKTSPPPLPNNPPPTPRPNEPNGNDNLPNLRDEAITAITQALNQEPKIADSELSKPNWKAEINNSSAANFINNLKEELLTEIAAKREGQTKNNELDELISQAEKKETYQELEPLINQIRTLSNLPHYQARQEKIKQLEEKLGKLDLNKYKEGVITTINNELKSGDNALSANELEPDNKDYENQLKRATTAEQVNQIKEKVTNDVGTKKAKKELDNLFEQAQKANTQQQKAAIKTKLLHFIKAENRFKQEISQKYHQQIQAVLKQLETSQSTSRPPKNYDQLEHNLASIRNNIPNNYDGRTELYHQNQVAIDNLITELDIRLKLDDNNLGADKHRELIVRLLMNQAQGPVQYVPQEFSIDGVGSQPIKEVIDYLKSLSLISPKIVQGGTNSLIVNKADLEQAQQEITRLKATLKELNAWKEDENIVNQQVVDFYLTIASNTQQLETALPDLFDQEGKVISANLNKYQKNQELIELAQMVAQLLMRSELHGKIIQALDIQREGRMILDENGVVTGQEAIVFNKYASQLVRKDAVDTLNTTAKKYNDLVNYQATATRIGGATDNSAILTADNKEIDQAKLTAVINDSQELVKINQQVINVLKDEIPGLLVQKNNQTEIDKDLLANLAKLNAGGSNPADQTKITNYEKILKEQIGYDPADPNFTTNLTGKLNGKKLSDITSNLDQVIKDAKQLPAWKKSENDLLNHLGYTKTANDDKKLGTEKVFFTDFKASHLGNTNFADPQLYDATTGQVLRNLTDLVQESKELTTLQTNYKILDDKLTKINADLGILDGNDNLTNKLRINGSYKDLKTASVVDKKKLDTADLELTRLSGEIHKIETNLTGLINTSMIDGKKVVNNVKLSTLKSLNDGQDLKGEDLLDGQGIKEIIEERDEELLLANRYKNQILNALGYPANSTVPNGVNQNVSVLPTIPAGENLASLLARPTQTQLDNANDWITDLEKGFKEILEIDPTDALPNNYTDLANLYKNQSGSQTIKQLKTRADNFDRIHTKLNGKVSDSELQALLDTIPTCSHTDYDTIKSERDTLKTENTQLKEHQCDCASQVAQKETQIITKIITDLQLSTERERENVLEAVITEIKNKITPPTDSSKDNKISELETKLANLQAPKSLNDLPISNEVKAEVIKISQDLGLTAQSCAKLEDATSYRELSNLQKEAFQAKLNSEVDSKNTARTMNYCFGALSLVPFDDHPLSPYREDCDLEFSVYLRDKKIADAVFEKDDLVIENCPKIDNLDISNNEIKHDLHFLNKMGKLKKLNIDKTITTVRLEYLPTSLEEIIFQVDNKPSAQLKILAETLKLYKKVLAREAQVSDELTKLEKVLQVTAFYLEEETKNIRKELYKERGCQSQIEQLSKYPQELAAALKVPKEQIK
ncbi:13654_t:CDS:10 [Entrophospora sp. SA101]|nr:13654_t:CDS:10 [Entrophospora sp. SA101]